MGVVYEAEGLTLGRHVALKLVPGELAHDGKAPRGLSINAIFHHLAVPIYLWYGRARSALESARTLGRRQLQYGSDELLFSRRIGGPIIGKLRRKHAF